MKPTHFVNRVAVLAALVGWISMSGVSSYAQSSGAAANLTGAGSTFAYPVYSKWTSEYSKVQKGIEINYQSVGSGAGITQLINKTVDFGGSDAPLTEAQTKSAGAPVVHIPIALGAVVPMYNLPGVDKTLTFSGPLLADIFLGKVTKWNDKQIADLNPGVKLPDLDLLVVHRSDGSGTTAIWTEYLGKVSPEWARGPKNGTAVNWPTGVGAKGNEGVSGTIRQTPGSVGYVELLYALENKVPYGDVKNAAGKVIRATPASVSAAAASLKSIPDDMKISLTNAEGDASYPISGLTWLLAYQHQPDASKGKALVQFVAWGIHDGQQFLEPMHYAPIPKEFMPKCETLLKSMVGPDGKPLWQ